MIRLALETTSDRLSVAARQDGSVALRAASGARQHAALLFPLIDEVLRELGGALRDVETLLLADGPGSFTGLRVGAAAALALARARPGLALASASTLLVRAVGASPPHGARVLVVTPALRGELYAAVYRLELPERVETLLAPTVATPESLHQQRPDLLIAEASEKLIERLADQFAVPLVRGAAALPQAKALLDLADVQGGVTRVDAQWEPSYGRPAEAQVRWEARHGRSLSDPAGFAR